MQLNIFLRQCYTETTDTETRDLIQQVFDALTAAAARFSSEHKDIIINFFPGQQATVAKYDGDFRQLFTEETGQEFNANNFGAWRDDFLDQADLFVAVRTGLSESTAVELSSFLERHKPNGFARSFIIKAELPAAALKTTLLKRVQGLSFAVENYKIANPAALEAQILAELFDPALIATMRSEKEAKAAWQAQIAAPMASLLMVEKKDAAVQTDIGQEGDQTEAFEAELTV